MKFISNTLFFIAAGLIFAPSSHAQPKQFPLGVDCNSSSNGSECYNCASKQCGILYPDGTYTSKTPYKECIDDSLNACDSKFPKSIRIPNARIPKDILTRPPNLKDILN